MKDSNAGTHVNLPRRSDRWRSPRQPSASRAIATSVSFTAPSKSSSARFGQHAARAATAASERSEAPARRSSSRPEPSVTLSSWIRASVTLETAERLRRRRPVSRRRLDWMRAEEERGMNEQGVQRLRCSTC